MIDERAQETPRTPVGSARTRRGRAFRNGLLAMATLLASGAALVVAGAGPSSASTLNAVATTATPSNDSFLGSGGSDTEFTLTLPPNAACSGDTAHDGYLVWSYLVKPTVNIGAITFNENTGASYGYGLYDSAATYYGPANTAQSTGEIIEIPTDFEWGPFIADNPTLLTQLLYTKKTSGVWEGGLACANSSGALTDNWNVQITFTKSKTDPNGFTWSAVPGPRGDTFASVTSADSDTFTEDAGNSFTPMATGTPTPALTESGALPGGVTFSGGVLSGDPTVTGTYPIDFTATNGIGDPGVQKFTLTVSAAFQITTTSPLPPATIGTKYSTTLAAEGGTTPYTWKATGLPKGLKANKKTGVIAGTVKSGTAKTYTVKVTATDKIKGTATKTFSLQLNAA